MGPRPEAAHVGDGVTSPWGAAPDAAGRLPGRIRIDPGAWMRRCLIALGALLLPLSAHAGVEIGAPAPALRGTLVSGDKFDLNDYRGKVVLINFYSSYCRICALEIGSLESALETYRDKGLEIVMLGVDRLEDKGRVARMLGTYNLQGAMVDELDACGFERRYPTPTAFLVDRDGIVREKLWGAKSQPRLRELLGPYLGR